MADQISVTSRHSYGSRIKSSFWKIFRWIIFIIGSIILLARNEHRSIEQKKALQEWAEIVQEAISTEIDTSLEWKEIHVYWETSSEAESLKDPIFWITVDDLKLSRNVEMYQWTESSQEHCTDNIWWSETCETTYSYNKQWEDIAIDSSSFYESAWHTNPSSWKYTSDEREKSPIKLWAYTLSEIFVGKLTNYNTINLSEQEVIVPSEYQTKTQWNETDDVSANNDNYLYWDNEDKAGYESFHIYDTYIYIGKDQNDPQVWDLKIYFSSVKPGSISVIWQQIWNEITSYTTSNDRTIALLEDWHVSAENMFLHAQQANKILTWVLRFVWLLLMYFGFSMMFEIITTLTKVLPFLSKIIGFSTSLVSFALTLTLWFLTIWIARIAVRPVVWICCLAVAAGWIVLLIKYRKNKKWDTNDKNDKNWTPEIINDKDAEIIEC